VPPRWSRRVRKWPAVALALLPGAARAQGVVIDSVVVETYDIFLPEEVEGNVLAGVMNALHMKTHPSVVRQELLFKAGDVLDPRRLAETERNLRRRGIFRRVVIDTVRVDGRLVARVFTSDGWTTNIDVGLSFTGNTLTWRAGAIEQNVLGTGHALGIVYRDEPDRHALRLLTQINRPFGTRAVLSGYYDDLSDGRAGGWTGGVPFLATEHRVGVELPGEAASRRVIQWRDRDTLAVRWRRAFVQRAAVGWAPTASPSGYIRIGVLGQIRQEQYLGLADTGFATPDSVTAAVGVFAEVAHSRFLEVTHYNGFAREEDVDLGLRANLQVWVAPRAFGYRAGGIAPLLEVQGGVGVPQVFARLRAHVHGMLTASGVDSGMVWGGLTVASRVIHRQATVLHVEAGAQRNPAPGAEFDIGHGIGPRGFEPHAFTGTRTAWGVLEHRVFLADALLDLFGLGVAGFVDYGGAWYPDQSPRVGGNVGLGLRLGGTTSTGPNVGRLDFAYRFGEGWSGKRWVVSFGQAYEF
jgi:Surface antigen variable number repeat